MWKSVSPEKRRGLNSTVICHLPKPFWLLANAQINLAFCGRKRFDLWQQEVSSGCLFAPFLALFHSLPESISIVETMVLVQAESWFSFPLALQCSEVKVCSVSMPLNFVLRSTVLAWVTKQSQSVTKSVPNCMHSGSKVLWWPIDTVLSGKIQSVPVWQALWRHSAKFCECITQNCLLPETQNFFCHWKFTVGNEILKIKKESKVHRKFLRNGIQTPILFSAFLVPFHKQNIVNRDALLSWVFLESWVFPERK